VRALTKLASAAQAPLPASNLASSAVALAALSRTSNDFGCDSKSDPISAAAALCASEDSEGQNI